MANLTSMPARLTAHDYRALPEGAPRHQLVDGELLMAPSSNLFHQEISSNIQEILKAHARQHQLGRVFQAPADVFLTEADVYQPDNFFVSGARLHLLAEDGVHGAPDLVVEILSPSTARLDLGPKKRVYAQCGVIEFWAVYPAERKVVVFDFQKSEDEPSATWFEDDTFGCKLLPGLRIEVAKFFVR